MPDEGFCQMCGSQTARARRTKGKANYICSDVCASEYRDAMIGAAMSNRLPIGVTEQQLDEWRAEVAGTRAYCWSCGQSMEISDKKCPACGKARHPNA